MAIHNIVIMLEFMNIAKALADENRVRAILALRKGELCVCQIIEFLGLAPSTVSKHMSILRNARLVNTRKKGRWVYYRLAEDNSHLEVTRALSWLIESLSDHPDAKRDEQKMQQVLQSRPEELCKMHSNRSELDKGHHFGVADDLSADPGYRVKRRRQT